MESSDEEQDDDQDDQESDTDKTLYLGRDLARATPEPDENDIDLDESTFPELDAQAAAFKAQDEQRGETSAAQVTHRIAVVNLDWDHVQAHHLYKIFSATCQYNRRFYNRRYMLAAYYYNDFYAYIGIIYTFHSGSDSSSWSRKVHSISP